MVDMVVDKSLFGARNRFFNSMHLLGHVNTRTSRLQHIKDTTQMSLGTAQTFNDLWARFM